LKPRHEFPESPNKFPEENPNPVMRLSKQGMVLYGNNACEVLLDCWGQRASEFIKGKALGVLYRAVENGAPIVDDFKCQDRVFTVTFMPVANSNYVNIYALDTTEKREMQNALQVALKEVRQLRNRLQQENRYLREEIKEEIGFDTIIGDSDAQTRLMHNIDQVASTDATVLITGETGTGKELIARAIHARSRRRGLPLIKINCAALPTELIESELFGHQKGAFTGALANKPGRFELANGGTLFPLQEQEFERVGGTRTIKVDVRIIAATNRVLIKNIASGEFREDLFYRLNVFPIHSPPLREHSDDIETLAYHFLRKYSKKIGRAIDTIETPVMKRLKDYYWPGNVRELENIIERAVILTDGRLLQLDEVFDINTPPMRERLKTLGEVEQEMIQAALKHCEWRIEGDSGAATRLAMAPSTLRERIKKYRLARHPADSQASTTEG